MTELKLKTSSEKKKSYYICIYAFIHHIYVLWTYLVLHPLMILRHMPFGVWH